MKRKVRQLAHIICWIYTLSPVALFAQFNHELKHQFRTISIEQGLSQSTVYTIIQDSLGFIWMGTQDGLNRYDGRTFQVYRPMKKNPSSLASSYIRSLYVDRKGVLWVGGNQGISAFDHVKETFHNYTLKVKPGEWFVSAIQEDDASTVWLATSGGELYTFDNKQGQFRQVDIHTTQPDIGSIWHIAKIGKQFLLGTDIGVFQFDPSTGKINRHALNKRIKVNYIFVDKDYIWAGTEGEGLLEYNQVTHATRSYRHVVGLALTSLADNDVRSLCKDKDGSLWIGTFKGLSILNIDKTTIHNYFQQHSVPHTLSQNSVRYIFRDKQNGMWMGTYYGGVSYHHSDDVRFNFLNRNTGNLSLNDNVVNIIKEDADKNIWIGTNDKGLNFWDREKGLVRHFSHNEGDASSLGSNNIKAIAFDNAGNVLIGTHNAGLSLFNPKTGKTIIFKHDPEDGASIAGDMVYALLKDKAGRIWVGTRSGLDRFNETARKFTHLYLDKNGGRLSSDEITALMEDSKGRIWIGTTNGVNILDPDQLTFDVFTGANLSNDVVTSITEDKKGRIWIATRDGLNQYDEKNKTFTVLNGDNNTIQGIIYGIISDKDGYLWLSTSKNLLRYDPDNRSYQQFDMKDGLQISQFNLSAVERTTDGMLLFGGINGLTFFYPHEVMPQKLNLQLTFTRLEVLNNPVFAGDIHEILDQHIDKQKQLRLDHDHRQFKIYFNTFDYISPTKIKYRYKLEGFDNEWLETAEVPSATYTNLKAGSYTFRVQAVGPLGESSPERMIAIKVSPPWWKSDWFFLIIGVCCIAGIYMAYLVITERLRTLHQLKMERLQREFTTNKLNLERVEREKIDSINQMKTDFFTNISHEFRTPLTLIISPLEELIGQDIPDKTTKKYHELMLQNAKRLYHLVDQILEFRKTEAGTKKLKISQGDVIAFVRGIYDSFMALAQKNTINYVFQSKENELQGFFDRDAIERICFNLLSNAFKYTAPGGSISIRVEKDDEDVLIQVEDSGVGIAKEEQEHIFERFYQVDSKEMNLGSGIGLAFTKKLVELHRGSIYLESEEGKGTLFTVRIPISDQSYQLEELLENQLVIERTPESEPDSDKPEDSTTEKLTDVPNKESLLIVDDNQEIVDYLHHYFGKQYDIKIAYNGKQALELLETETVDLIISDVMMPEIDGIQLSKKIKQNITTCHIPIILLTAKSETTHQIKGLEAGADDYVAKPFSIALLDAKVQNILKSRKRLKEYFSSSREIVPENIAFNALDEEFLRQAIHIIETHIGDSDFSVDKFSREIGMSRSNLYLKLKAITGESATDFVKRIRFNKATELLGTRQYTVAQVAYMCGFNSPSYFSTAFKQYYGCMPTEYLEKKNQE